MAFPIYLPYNPTLTEFIMKNARTDLFLLDVQLGSTCNARCPRCDSACCDLDEPADLDVQVICSLAEQITKRLMERVGRLSLDEQVLYQSMGFICGLGEPTAGCNLEKLKALLAGTYKLAFDWSIFTNNIYWDDELDRYLKNGGLSVMIQYNSSKVALVAETMGVGRKRATEHLQNRLHLQKLAQTAWLHSCTYGVYTNVTASIVPDRDNLDELMSLITECDQYSIFPLIAELENAGHSEEDGYYEAHKLEDHELRTLHQQIEHSLGVLYEIPICPAVIGAIHVNNHNKVTVDTFTGLSCGWFGMGDPKPHTIGDIREMSREEIVRAILDYREQRVPEVAKTINGYPKMVFGGCGGNARKLLTDYVALYGYNV